VSAAATSGACGGTCSSRTFPGIEQPQVIAQGATFQRNDNGITLCQNAAEASLEPPAMKSSAAAASKSAPRETLNIRIPAAERHLIDRAARSSGKTRTDFILGAARRAAEEALLDRSLLLVSPAKFEKFLALLDAPAKPNARLRRTMKSPPPWGEG
jgi:uncharacterized protein (DUF1778 family)